MENKKTTERQGIRISIIVPVYGVEPYIEKCVRTLFGQTYDNIEYIFVNDCTKDRSMEILEKTLEDYPERRNAVTIINKEKNEGLPAARKSGISVATGDYILNIDSDDWIEPDTVESLVKEAEKTGAELIYYDYFREHGEEGDMMSKFRITGCEECHEPDYTEADKEDYINDILAWKDTNAFTVNKLMSRRFFTEENIVFPVYPMHEDLLLTCQMIYYARSIVHLRKAFYHYRQDNPTSICNADGHKKDVHRKRESSYNMMELYKVLETKPDKERFQKVMRNLLLRVGWYAFKFERTMYGMDNKKYAKELFRIPVSKKYFLPLMKQILIKTYLTFFLPFGKAVDTQAQKG